MRRLLLLAALALLVPAGTAAAARQTLFFDAGYTKLSAKGPGDDAVGHRQIASGVLRDVRHRAAGHFAFVCRWTAALPGGDFRERCSGHGTTKDGRVDVAGPALRHALTHTWSVTGGTGRYRGAHGQVVVRDLGTKETLVSLTVVPRRGVTLRAGVIPHPSANSAFRSRAGARCSKAASALAALPPFPFDGFDPLHPDAAQLPDVGRFFTGPHDARPILQTLADELAALGRPPAQRSEWKRLLAERAQQLTLIQRQDDAALAADVAGFVKSVKDSDANFRVIAIEATVFDVPRCVL
jgi:hypothetical protein